MQKKDKIVIEVEKPFKRAFKVSATTVGRDMSQILRRSAEKFIADPDGFCKFIDLEAAS